MAQYSFGSGSLFGIPAGATPTPIQFGVLQDVTLDFSYAMKELRGQFQYPVAVARGAGKATWKAKYAKLNGVALNNIFFNGTSASTLIEQAAIAELGTVAGTTITVANSATWASDLGVVSGTTGNQYVRVASAPVAGTSYSCAAGVYTFAAGDVGMQFLISYTYTVSTGNKTTVTNQLMGNQPTFAMVFNEQFNGKTVQIRCPQAVMGKLGFATKLEDFTVPEADGEIFADSAGNVAIISMSE